MALQDSSVNLPDEFVIRHSTALNLPTEFSIQRTAYGVSLPAEFYVRQTSTRATDFTIIDNTRGLTIHDADREMTVTPRRRMRVK